MSFIARSSIYRSALITGASTRSFSISARRAVLSEAEVNHENRDAAIDHHKEDSLKKQEDGQGQWKEELASQSEAAIKADREEIHNVEEDVKKLQKESEEAMKKDRH